VRFHLEGGDDSDSRPDPLEPTPDSTSMDHHQRVEFLRLLHDGLGRTMACAQLGIARSVLRRTMTRSRPFRKAIEHVEQVRADNLFTGLYAAALRGDTRAAMFLISRQDRAAGRRPVGDEHPG
jgi:hypothetical protein